MTLGRRVCGNALLCCVVNKCYSSIHFIKSKLEPSFKLSAYDTLVIFK